MKRIPIRKRIGIVAALVAALAVAAPAGYWDQMRTILEPEDDYNVADEYGRLGIAKRGASYMFRYPVFGVGLANFPRAEGTISPIAVERMSQGQAVRWIAPHNTYVQVGAELGIGGFLIWLSLLAYGTIGLWKLWRRIPPDWEHHSPERRFLRDACQFLPVSVLGFAVTSFFLSHGYTTPAYLLFGLVGGVHYLVARELRGGAPAHGGRPARGGRTGGRGRGRFRRVPRGQPRTRETAALRASASRSQL